MKQCKECLEHARLLGISGERELMLLAKLEQAEAENMHKGNALVEVWGMVDALRAELAQSQARERIMRRQLAIAQELIHSVCCERHACVRGCSDIKAGLAATAQKE